MEGFETLDCNMPIMPLDLGVAAVGVMLVVTAAGEISGLAMTTSSEVCVSATSDSGVSLFGVVLNLLNMLSRPDYFLRVDGIPANQNFEVQMFACRGARVSNVA